METVENFLPPKTYESSKNVGNYVGKGQVINISSVENVEKSVACGKIVLFTFFIHRFCGKLMMLPLIQLISALFFQHFAFVIPAIYLPRLGFAPFLAVFLEPEVERELLPPVILAASRLMR